MKSHFMCLMLALVPVLSHAAAIPKAFQGEWVNANQPSKTCTNMSGVTHISSSEYTPYDNDVSCLVKKVITKGKKSILIKVSCGNEGDYYQSNDIILTLNEAKHLDITYQDTDVGTQTHHRCPRSKK